MSPARTLALILGLALVAAACGDDGAGDATTSATSSSVPPTSAPPSTLADPGPAGPPERLAPFTESWGTDWSKTTIDLEELQVGIPAADPRDRIAPLDDPDFESIAAAGEWLAAREPGLLVEVGAVARFYPLSILTLHEVVNDEIEGIPVAVTFCPLCNSGVAFDRRVDGQTLRFGVSGLLRNSDLVMWDGATVSLWQQITGEAIVGDLAGTKLDLVPSGIVSLAEFAARFPAGEVLARPLDDFAYPYGLNPYQGYSSRNRPLGFFTGELDVRYPALERVVSVKIGETVRAYPFSALEAAGAINDEIEGTPIVVLWGGTTADALDTSAISSGKPIGTGVAFSAVVDGQRLTFSANGDDTYGDAETGTTWSLLGAALDGPMAGATLELLPHQNDFWFAWAAFNPDGEVYAG